ERVIPAAHLNASTPSVHDAQRELLDIAGRSVGVGTARDIADYFRIKFAVAKPRIDELVESGRLLPAVVHGSKHKVFVHADARSPSSVDARALLSMFDPVVWFRPRAEWLFDFHYRIEIYTPESRRKYGYYVLPFLLGDQLVARVDLKADRANGTLLVPGAFTEHHADPKVVAVALAAELREMATWLNLENIRVGTKGDLSKPVRSALSSRVIVER
ncbi:MAG: DNA glycosylase AlkZ-like family protein, partial [Actinomycetes bacterium]